MSVLRPMPVVAEPVTELTRWSRVRVKFKDGSTSVHFVGDAWDGGRVSSPILSYDPKTKTGTSRSGRTYRLVGEITKMSMDAAYVWATWRSINQVLSFRPLIRLGRSPKCSMKLLPTQNVSPNGSPIAAKPARSRSTRKRPASA